MRPHRGQSTRLPRPWDSPGKNTGVGCHFLLQCMKVKSESEVAQSCPTLSDPRDCSPPGSSIHGIFQARVLEWGAIAFSAPKVYWIIYPSTQDFTAPPLIMKFPCTSWSVSGLCSVPFDCSYGKTELKNYCEFEILGGIGNPLFFFWNCTFTYSVFFVNTFGIFTGSSLNLYS